MPYSWIADGVDASTAFATSFAAAWVVVDESMSTGQLVGGVLVVVGIVLVKLDEAGDGQPLPSGSPATTLVSDER